VARKPVRIPKHLVHLGEPGRVHYRRLFRILEEEGRLSESVKIVIEDAAQWYDYVAALDAKLREIGAKRGDLALAAVSYTKTGEVEKLVEVPGEDGRPRMEPRSVPVFVSSVDGLFKAFSTAKNRLAVLHSKLGLDEDRESVGGSDDYGI